MIVLVILIEYLLLFYYYTNQSVIIDMLRFLRIFFDIYSDKYHYTSSLMFSFVEKTVIVYTSRID